MLRVKRTVQPTVEPITVAEAMVHCRIDSNTEEDFLSALISAAREWCEDATASTIASTTWALSLDEFPCYSDALRGSDQYRILVPRPPVQSVSSIAYIDTDGASQTLSTDVYAVDTSSPYECRVTLKYGQSWPSTQNVANAVTVTYVAGYQLPGDVPPRVRHALKLLVGHWYENREAVGTVGKEIELTVNALLGLGDMSTVG